VVVGAQLAETLVSSGRQRPDASSTAGLRAGVERLASGAAGFPGGGHPVGYLREQSTLWGFLGSDHSLVVKLLPGFWGCVSAGGGCGWLFVEMWIVDASILFLCNVFALY